MKQCSKCGATKSFDEFPKRGPARGGWHSWCRFCHSQSQQAHRSTPAARERKREYDKKRRQDPTVRNRSNDYLRERRSDPSFRERRNATVAAHKYGIPIDEVLRLRAKTHCDCCGQTLLPHPHHRHIDHCHETGQVRGMVCRECNLSMRGPSEQCIARLRCCVSYLEKHRGN